MAWTTQQLQAIVSYAKRRNFKMMLSSSTGINPKACFLDQQGIRHDVEISEVVREFNTSKNDEKRERARVKREENKQPWKRRIV